MKIWMFLRRSGKIGFMEKSGIAYLSSKGRYSSFTFSGEVIRFMTSPRLIRYEKVKEWDNGYIEVLARYAHGYEEESIDLVPILENLCIDPGIFLRPIKKVEVAYE